VVAVLGAGVPLIIDYLTSRNDDRVVRLAVPPASELGGGTGTMQRFEFFELDSAAATRALEAGDVDGVRDLSTLESPTLVTESEPSWLDELNGVLTDVALAERLEASGVSRDEFAALMQPVDLRLELQEEAPATGSGRIATIIGIMLFAIFTGTGL